ncbi:MAG: hypothetical protein ACI9FB_001024 [Candidatus Azotimanducaceae bacterium]|jgi:uncharacterized protein YaeQ
MAIKPTIYKMNISVSDMDRNFYDALNLTLALHPSETVERMMVRVIAYCLNAQENLTFSKGLSAVEEPDVWAHTLDEQILLWIDVGEPAFDRMKKAKSIAKKVIVYCFNTKSDVWWQKNAGAVGRLDISVRRFDWPQIQALAQYVERGMSFSVTITGNSAFVATEKGECELTWVDLQSGKS